MEIDFEPKKETITQVFEKSTGKIIDELKGAVIVNAKNYEEHLPIECKTITITTELISISTIEKSK